MIRTSIEKIANDIGFDIAHSDDVVQSDLINGLARGFSNMQKREYEMQLAYLSDKLNNDSHRLIKELYEFIKLKENKE